MSRDHAARRSRTSGARRSSRGRPRAACRTRRRRSTRDRGGPCRRARGTGSRTAAGAEQAELLADRGEDEVGRGERDQRRRSLAEPRADDARPIAIAELPLRELPVPLLEDLLRVERVEPEVDAQLHVAERQVAEPRADRRTAPARAPGTPARPVATQSITTKTREVQERRAEVLLAGTGRRATRPTRAAAAPRCFARRQRKPIRSRRRLEQLALLRQVGREEDHDQDLAELGRLERRAGRSATHSRAPLIVWPMPGTIGSSSRIKPGQADRVRVRVEHAGRRGRAPASATNATSPTPSHVACSAARSASSRRKIIANPRPTRSAAVGNSTGIGAAARTGGRRTSAPTIPGRDQTCRTAEARPAAARACRARRSRRRRSESDEREEHAATRPLRDARRSLRWSRRGSWAAALASAQVRSGSARRSPSASSRSFAVMPSASAGYSGSWSTSAAGMSVSTPRARSATRRAPRGSPGTSRRARSTRRRTTGGRGRCGPRTTRPRAHATTTTPTRMAHVRIDAAVRAGDRRCGADHRGARRFAAPLLGSALRELAAPVRGGSSRRPSSSSWKSRMTTVMLSMPPARLAALTRRSAASCGSGVGFEDRLDLGLGDHAGQAVGAQEEPVAVDQRDVLSSTSTSGSVPSARVRTLRCGWMSASCW